MSNAVHPWIEIFSQTHSVSVYFPARCKNAAGLPVCFSFENHLTMKSGGCLYFS